jgi:hypothetical protein
MTTKKKRCGIGGPDSRLISMRGVVLSKQALETFKALQRAIKAGASAEEVVDEDEARLLNRLDSIRTGQRSRGDEEAEKSLIVEMAHEILDISKRGMILAGRRQWAAQRHYNR